MAKFGTKIHLLFICSCSYFLPYFEGHFFCGFPMAGWVENQLKSDHSVRRGRFRLAGCQWWGHSALLTFIQATQLWPHNVGKADLMGGMLPLGPSTLWSPYQNKILLKYRILCKPAHWLMIIQFCLKVSGGTATWRIRYWGIWVFENPLLAYLPNDLLYKVKMCGDPCIMVKTTGEAGFVRCRWNQGLGKAGWWSVSRKKIGFISESRQDVR